jgi:hypothetical protein
MIFPYCPMPKDLSWEEEAPKQKPSFHKATISPWEGEFVITKGDADAGTWWVAQIHEVLTDRVKVKTYTTISHLWRTTPPPQLQREHSAWRKQPFCKHGVST